ncbi:hypothetical protein ACLB2K_044581 [Fragaria x ananassa]
MLIMVEYDGLSPVEDVSLNHLEVWVSIVGFRFAMRNNKVLSLVANGLGVFVRADPVSAVDGEPELLASWVMETVGLVKEPILQVEEAVPTGLDDGLSGSKEAVALVVTPSTFSRGNPS